MTPVQVCEPLFQYICRLGRMARRDRSEPMDVVRSRIRRIIEDIRAEAGREGLTEHFAIGPNRGNLELVLLFFTDYMLRESRLPFANEWVDLADELHNELGGYNRFFELLDEAFVDANEANARARLPVYYVCLSLGFGGALHDEPKELNRLVEQIGAKINRDMDRAEARLCEQAYEHTLDAPPPPPVKDRLVGIGIVLVGLVVVLFVANFWMYRATASQLREDVQAVNAAVAAQDVPVADSPNGG